MKTKVQLSVLNFMQFFVWGAWLISIGYYLGAKLQFSGSDIGAIFSTLGIASLIMPAVTGIIADKLLNAERVLGLCHALSGAFLLWASQISQPNEMFWVMLGVSLFYMPTIALNNTVSYTILQTKGFDVVKDFPPIRVLGTVGFIVAMWLVDLTGWKSSNAQLIFASITSFLLAVYAFSLPACPPSKTEKKSWISALGLDALVLFRRTQMAIFFLFAMFLGGALQITNAFGGSFLRSFETIPEYAQSFVVQNEIITLSISQISESVFILTIPFFLKRFGIKWVMFMSMLAWVFRFGLFGIGNPGDGLIFLLLSMVIYGMAFDFFNISGSLFVEQEAPESIRASAQGLFMLMTNGLGAMMGGYLSGKVVDMYSVYGSNGELLARDWSSIWMVFAGYALVLAVVFPWVFRNSNKKSQPK